MNDRIDKSQQKHSAMEQNCQNVNLDPKHLFDQLTTARNEINNLRYDIFSFRTQIHYFLRLQKQKLLFSMCKFANKVINNLNDNLLYLSFTIIIVDDSLIMIIYFRQQIKSLRYKHEKDVDNIRRLLGLCSDGITVSETTNPEEASTSDSQDDSLLLKPIGVISTWFPNKRGTPRQTGICEKALGKIELFNSVFTNPEHALEGLNEFSHMWYVFGTNLHFD